jgi:hypothetical protein
MNTQCADLVLPATLPEVQRVLLDPLALPAWNPALQSVEGPQQPAPGFHYTIKVRPGLTGSLEYTSISTDRIEIAWQVTGFRETSSWTLEPHGPSTIARHEFEHAGPLASALRHAYQGVAALRLQRLAHEVETCIPYRIIESRRSA